MYLSVFFDLDIAKLSNHVSYIIWWVLISDTNKIWPIKLVDGPQPEKGKKADDIGRENGFEREKRTKYEQEKCTEQIFNNKW